MYSLRLLGGLSLEGPAGPVEGPAAQPVRLALLSLLAVPEDRPVTRDRVVAFLWPEQSARRGRRNLSDNLYLLRRELGDDVVEGVGGTLRLNRTRVHTDVADFQEALRAGDPAEAVRLYGGPFLDGVHLRDCVEFERWSDGQRERWARRYAEALQTLARAAESTGDLPGAVAWRRRLAAERPYDISATIALMRALERAGEPAAAIRAGLSLERRVAEDLGAEPSPALREEIARIRSAPVPGPSLPEPSPVPPSVRAPETEAVPRPAVRQGREASVEVARGEEGRRRPTDLRLTPARAAAAVATLAVVGLGLWLVSGADNPASSATADSDQVAVFPFRVGGASPSLAYLEEGMVDLLATKLTGEVGPRALNPRTVVAAWRRAGGAASAASPRRLRELARSLGAGTVLTGEVVGAEGAVTLSARMEHTATSGPPRSAEVVGPADSLPALVDRLVSGLLLRSYSGSGATLASVTTSSLPALRAYLAGRDAWRRGDRDGAARHYDRALDHDSAFGLAAVGLVEASFTLPGGSTGRHPHARRGLQLAIAARERLSREDRQYLDALARPRYPEVTFPWSEVITTWETVIHELADRPEAWYQLGLHMADFGPQAGRPDAPERAATAFGRAVELDSTYLPAIERLIWSSARSGDDEAVDRLAPVFLRADPTGATADYTRWRIALARRDDEMLARLRARLGEMDQQSLINIVGFGQVDGVGLDDARRAAAELGARLRERRGLPGPYDRVVAAYTLKNHALNTGRPDAADSLLRIRWEGRLDWPRRHHDRITAALYEGGDTTGVWDSAVRLEERKVGDMPTIKNVLSRTERGARATDLCLAGQWRLWNGDTLRAESTLREVRGLESIPGTPCAVTLELLLAAARGGSAARRARSLAEEYVAEAWSWPMGFMLQFAAARLYERLGDHAAAADALRRRPYRARQGAWTLGHALHEEGRLSLLAADTAAALTAYRRWLALQDHSGEGRRDEVARVREVVGPLEEAVEAGIRSAAELDRRGRSHTRRGG